jgi:hypothetical protein
MIRSSTRRGIFAAVLALMTLGTSYDSAAAQDGAPIQLSVFPPIQLTGESESIRGVRLSLLFGRNENVTGLDWSFIANQTTGNEKAWQLGLVGLVDGNFTGWQANGIANVTKGEMYGVQTGIINVTGSARGFSWGGVNYSKGNYKGLQLAVVNYAQSMAGGVQVGLINIIKEGGMFPFFPIVNWGK